MSARKKPTSGSGANEPIEQWPGIDSHFRLIIVAALRSKQLMRGSMARIETDPLRRRNTSIALEEVKRGLVSFTLSDPETDKNSGDHAGA
jgi:DNA-directed RNA polymerase omega subunit